MNKECECEHENHFSKEVVNKEDTIYHQYMGKQDNCVNTNFGYYCPNCLSDCHADEDDYSSDIIIIK